MSFAITASPIDPAALKRSLEADSAGAYVAFEGWVRDHNDGAPVVALEYEAHETIAVREGEKIVEEARRRFPILAARCEHRVGKLAIGDCAVWVGVTAAHRGAAFDACRFVIEEIKRSLPVWKRERFVDGSEWKRPGA
jgi:molybdopterin synthase catalytic subunit